MKVTENVMIFSNKHNKHKSVIDHLDFYFICVFVFIVTAELSCKQQDTIYRV